RQHSDRLRALARKYEGERHLFPASSKNSGDYSVRPRNRPPEGLSKSANTGARVRGYDSASRPSGVSAAGPSAHHDSATKLPEICSRTRSGKTPLGARLLPDRDHGGG